jgi:hypothetical protein
MQLLVSGANTLALRVAIAQFIDSHQEEIGSLNESVEIFLYYETLLKSRLNLLSAIESTSYANEIGRRDSIDVDQLVDVVRNTSFENLYKMVAFQKLFQDSTAYQQVKLSLKQANDDLVAAEEQANHSNPYHERANQIQKN